MSTIGVAWKGALSSTRRVTLEERPSVIERAFQIAKSGAVTTIAELSAQLTAEGYANNEQLLAGRSLALKITRMIADVRPTPVP